MEQPYLAPAAHLKLNGEPVQSENPVVLTAVLVTLGVYIVLLVWARKKDLEDASKVHESAPLIIVTSKLCSIIYSACNLH